jgi:hypothetical protein
VNNQMTRKDIEMPSKKHEAVLAYLLRDLTQENVFYFVECIDVTEDGLIFALDPELIKSGLFSDPYIDSRYLSSMKLELIIVPHPPDLEQ